jgi:hypothetical protein
LTNIFGYSVGMKGITVDLIGWLGGASKQAVSQSRNPSRWLKSRVRRALSPEFEDEGAFEVVVYTGRYLKSYAERGAEKLILEAQRKLQTNANHIARKRGRPRTQLEVGSLGELLGMIPSPNSTLHNVFQLFVQQSLDQYLVLLPGPDHEISWQELHENLDAWLPYSAKAPKANS